MSFLHFVHLFCRVQYIGTWYMVHGTLVHGRVHVGVPVDSGTSFIFYVGCVGVLVPVGRWYIFLLPFLVQSIVFLLVSFCGTWCCT